MLSVVLSTRNEREGLEILVCALLAILEQATGGEFELLVVDDSDDGSDVHLAERLSRFPGRVRFVHREASTGLASAIGDGIRLARRRYVLAMDADFNHSPLELPPMLADMAAHDLLAGSRFLPGGGMPGHRFRQAGSRLFNAFVRRALAVSTTDNLAGFWIMERQRVLAIADRWPLFHGYGDYYIRLLLAAHWLGLRIRERPVRYLNRLTGESKTRFAKELLRYTRTVLELRRNAPALRSRLLSRPEVGGG